MPSAQAGIALLTGVSIGIAAMAVVLGRLGFGSEASPLAKADAYRLAPFVALVVGALAVSFAGSVAYLYVAEFGPIIGVLSARLLFVVAVATLFVGIFGPLGLLVLRVRLSYRHEHDLVRDEMDAFREPRDAVEQENQERQDGVNALFEDTDQ